MLKKENRIYIAGGSGLIGCYLQQKLQAEGYKNIYSTDSGQLDLKNKEAVDKFFEEYRPDHVFLLAATRGSIEDYYYVPVNYFVNDMQIVMNVLDAAYRHNVQKLVYAGSVCVYPEREDGVLREEDFRSGWVPERIESFALSKAAGTALCEYYNRQYQTNFVTALIGNIYGVTDNGKQDTNTVIPAIIKQIQRENINDHITIWGNGEQNRDFLHARDCASALLAIMNSDMTGGICNVSSGVDITINELVKVIAEVMGYNGRIEHDLAKPGGAKRAHIDISRLLSLGWRPEVDLKDGIREYVSLLEQEII